MRPPAALPERRSGVVSPVAWLLLGLLVAVLLIVSFSLYTVREIRTLRDEQTALSERNRLDALQIIRIQQNLSSLAGALRDMLGGTEPYPLVAWANTFARLRADLEHAIARERELAPVGRSAAERAQLDVANRRLWEGMDRAFALAQRGDDAGAAEVVRGEATARHGELVTLVSQLLIRNTRIDEAAADRARGIYDRVSREIFLLAAVLVAGVLAGGMLLVRTTRQTFESVEALAAERRALSWRMLRMQEDLQTEFARELHDEFGQILTAVGMMLGRLRGRVTSDQIRGRSDEGRGTRGEGGGTSDEGRVTSDEWFVRDLAEIQDIAQRTLDRIRTRSRMLHPVILDDFGLQQAVAWYVDEFARQQGIGTTFVPSGELASIPPDVATHLYRVVQESLTNVARHAGASRASVSLSHTDARITLSIGDDGRGLAGGGVRASVSGGIGMTSMRERAELMGGTFTLGTSELGGLLVTVRVPLARP